MTLSFVDTREPPYRAPRLRAGQAVGEDLRLLPQRRHEAVDLATVLRALADGKHVGVIGAAEIVADDNAAFDGQSGGARQGGIGANASGHDHHLAFQPRAVIEEEAADPRGAEHRRCAPFEVRVDAQLVERRAEQASRALVELHFHQVASQMNDVDFDAQFQ